MAGHSKWANIKHKKASQDAKRGKIFTKLIREITVAAKLGGIEPSDNPRLRAAIDKSLSANMTKETIQRAIDRGAGSGDNDDVEELTYEGYGPSGVAVLVEVITDNKNRTVAELRHAFNKYGGNLGTAGSVAYLFTKRGQILLHASDEELIMEVALNAGAEDIIARFDGLIDIATKQNNMLEVKAALVKAGIEVIEAEVTTVPISFTEIQSNRISKIIGLIDMLEELDDVQNVFVNANFPSESLESLG